MKQKYFSFKLCVFHIKIGIFYFFNFAYEHYNYNTIFLLFLFIQFFVLHSTQLDMKLAKRRKNKNENSLWFLNSKRVVDQPKINCITFRTEYSILKEYKKA
jgi:hypothetical protein